MQFILSYLKLTAPNYMQVKENFDLLIITYFDTFHFSCK